MLKVGQHVVLINDQFRKPWVAKPVLGVVYTIRWVGEAPEPFNRYPLQCHLVEVVNPKLPHRRTGEMIEPSFMVSRFRPLAKLTTESFTSGLTPIDHLELVMEYEGLRKVTPGSAS